MASYVALLRGINVGGKNKVPMAALRAAVESGGHRSVRTYIQSGNVLFDSNAPAAGIEADLEALLARELGMDLVVVVRSHRQLRSVVRDAPDGFGTQPERFHSDAVFLKSPLTAAQAMQVVQTRDGVDRAWPGRGVLYFERLSERRTQSRMSRIMGTPEYQLMTIRSWSTTTKLLAMLEQD
jgi:uncharacterized protein (DUF1697 family)